jgi:hypothetical protein
MDKINIQLIFLSHKIKLYLIITNLNLETKDIEIIIPFNTDLAGLESRLIALKNESEEGLTIEKIKEINLYLGIDEYYTLIDNYTIPFVKDEKFFQYYRKKYSGSLIDFGVVVQAYMDIAALDLFKKNKYQNIINTGGDYNTFSSSIVIKGNH